jgi:hypothetical protein
MFKTRLNRIRNLMRTQWELDGNTLGTTKYQTPHHPYYQLYGIGVACTNSACKWKRPYHACSLASKVEGECNFSFFLCSQHVPLSSQWVNNMYTRCPMCSPRVFPIAPCFNPVCFAESPPLLTYIGGPKGEALHLSIESSILGSLHTFNFFFFFFVMGQSNWLITPKNKNKIKGWTCETPPTN